MSQNNLNRPQTLIMDQSVVGDVVQQHRHVRTVAAADRNSRMIGATDDAERWRKHQYEQRVGPLAEPDPGWS